MMGVALFGEELLAWRLGHQNGVDCIYTILSLPKGKILGTTVARQANSGSCLSGPKTIRVGTSSMQLRQMNIHFAFANRCPQ